MTETLNTYINLGAKKDQGIEFGSEGEIAL